ncbi:cupin domain-containing protein [Pseudomonas sp. v388]|nr:cupin domain-containing protein [Pseudomonas sp. v388]RRV04952.1 cupin domain-containing protein [Pseudomonas sp. v388]
MSRALVVIFTLLIMAGCAVTDKKRPSVAPQVLLKSTSSWDGTPYRSYPKGQPELTILKINIPANTRMKWHKHPIPNAAYVVSGQITVQAKGSSRKIQLKAGDTLAEMVDIMHRGVTGSEPVELIVFYAGTPGTPLSQ